MVGVVVVVHSHDGGEDGLELAYPRTRLIQALQHPIELITRTRRILAPALPAPTPAPLLEPGKVGFRTLLKYKTALSCCTPCPTQGPTFRALEISERSGFSKGTH